MENFIVSARKYRPETFQTVIGQPSITITLKNAIRGSQLAHAYLFCGPRGVGKTTCARIFAKTINCFNITSETEACNQCESCVSFNSSRSFNIHELDAASNNSVEDIRSLIEQVRIPPQIAKYSIYIIDEVHMLSSQAFNAFLKTLEEPPPHAIFILATTEKHKILPTILSRCQIFDFSRIKIEDIVLHLESIAREENIDAETEGLNIIAQKADGAMRDALSIFDQIASFSEGKISYHNVITNLNVLDYDYYFKLTDAILATTIPETLMIFNDVLDKGFDGHNFINGLSRHFRDLLVCSDEITLQLLEVGALIREKYRSQSKACSRKFLENSLSLTNQCDLSYKSSRNQRLHVELCLVQLCGVNAVEKKKTESAKGSLNKEASISLNTDSGNKLPSPEGRKEARSDVSSGPPVTRAASSVPNIKQAEKGEEINIDTVTIKTPADIKPSTGSGIFNKAGTNSQKSDQVFNQAQTSSGTDKKSLSPEPDHLKTSTPSYYNDKNNISIRDVMKGTVTEPVTDPEDNPFLPENNEKQDIVQENNDDFTEKELADAWKRFANQIKNKHPRLFNTLLANKPSICNQEKIEFELSNPMQEEALNKIKSQLLKYLKQELNSNIELFFRINEAVKESRLYLPEDKFEHMVKKNPDLAVFRQKFNLDFE